MHERRNNAGITLIALIITIIVLLILAGVSINAVVGENGVLSQAQMAKEKTEEAKRLENIQMEVAGYVASTYSGEETAFLEYMEETAKFDEILPVKVSMQDGNIVEYTDRCYVRLNKFWYTSYADGEIVKDKVTWDGTMSSSFQMDGDTYLITSAADLTLLANEVNNGNSFEGCTFKLTTTIDLGAKKTNGIWTKGIKEWTPIGLKTAEGTITYFSGMFDGQNNTIRGVYAENPNYYEGIFGANRGTIKNVNVCYNFLSGLYAGALVGHNTGTIFNCYSTGEGITSILENGTNYGGIVGINGRNGIVDNCYNKGKIIVQGNFDSELATSQFVKVVISGVCVINYNILQNCYNEGNLASNITSVGEGTNPNKLINFFVSGICYSNYFSDDNDVKGKIINSYNKGNVEITQVGTESNETYASGICIFNNNPGAIIEKCYNLGNITDSGVASYAYCAGIISYNDKATINACYNSGTITNNSVGEVQTGGINAQNTGHVSNCYNFGTIGGRAIGRNDRGVEYGGIAASTYVKDNIIGASVVNCYSYGTFKVDMSNASDTNPVCIGGIMGYIKSGTVSNCYYLDTTASGGINKDGVELNVINIDGSAESKTSDEMKDSSFVTLLNSEEFKVKENGYPILKWQ